MSNPENNTFANVDLSPNPEAFVHCLNDQYASNPTLIQNKHVTLQLMELNPGHCVLDVGCGTGIDATLMAEQVAPYRGD